MDLLRQQLIEVIRASRRVLVAFSGGVDSAVVAQAAWLACGEQALAITAVSDSLASGEQDSAAELARQIGIRHLCLATREFENPAYIRNTGDRCYHCKTELYSRIRSAFPEYADWTLLNGANQDDLGDYRPGMQAAREHQVRSPLIEAGINKQQVRALAQSWNLPVWDKPAMPCLSSRIAYGLEATPERVRRVDQAERWLRDTCGLREFRVRHEAHDLARLEVSPTEFPRLISEPLRSELTAYLHNLGFKFITLDLDGFRSGSMNAGLPLVTLESSPK